MGADVDVLVEIDQSRAWELYCALNGDTLQVAAAMGAPEPSVTTVAQRYGWPERLRKLTHVQGHQGTLKALARARCAVQANRLLAVLDGVLDSIESAPDRKAVLEDWTTVVGKSGASRSGAALMQLAAAMETAQNMQYKALGDNGKDGVTDAGAAGGDLLTAMQKALTESSRALGTSPGKVAAAVV